MWNEKYINLVVPIFISFILRTLHKFFHFLENNKSPIVLESTCKFVYLRRNNRLNNERMITQSKRNRRTRVAEVASDGKQIDETPSRRSSRNDRARKKPAFVFTPHYFRQVFQVDSSRWKYILVAHRRNNSLRVVEVISPTDVYTGPWFATRFPRPMQRQRRNIVHALPWDDGVTRRGPTRPREFPETISTSIRSRIGRERGLRLT